MTVIFMLLSKKSRRLKSVVGVAFKKCETE